LREEDEAADAVRFFETTEEEEASAESFTVGRPREDSDREDGLDGRDRLGERFAPDFIEEPWEGGAVFFPRGEGGRSSSSDEERLVSSGMGRFLPLEETVTNRGERFLFAPDGPERERKSGSCLSSLE
jgi:hypothetical protein